MIETILLAVVAAAPAIAAVASVIAAVIKLIKNGKSTNEILVNAFEDLKAKVEDTAEYENLTRELKIAHEENAALKQKLNELLTEMTRIQH